jgi:hypothetical protein
MSRTGMFLLPGCKVSSPKKKKKNIDDEAVNVLWQNCHFVKWFFLGRKNLKKPYVFFQCKMCFRSKSLNPEKKHTENDEGIFSDGFFFWVILLEYPEK